MQRAQLVPRLSGRHLCEQQHQLQRLNQWQYLQHHPFILRVPGCCWLQQCWGHQPGGAVSHAVWLHQLHCQCEPNGAAASERLRRQLLLKLQQACRAAGIYILLPMRSGLEPCACRSLCLQLAVHQDGAAAQCWGRPEPQSPLPIATLPLLLAQDNPAVLQAPDVDGCLAARMAGTPL